MCGRFNQSYTWRELVTWEIAEKNWSGAPYLCSLARRNNMGWGAFERSVRILSGLGSQQASRRLCGKYLMPM